MDKNKNRCQICFRPIGKGTYTEEFCSPYCYQTDLHMKIQMINEAVARTQPAPAVSAPGGGGSGERPQVVPQALSLAITSNFVVSGSATGSYTYFDSNNNPEGTSTFKWYRADDTDGTNKAVLTSFTTTEMAISASEEDKYLVFEVTPVSTIYPYTGAATEVYSTNTASGA